jgi:hypothetical protein
MRITPQNPKNLQDLEVNLQLNLQDLQDLEVNLQNLLLRGEQMFLEQSL